MTQTFSDFSGAELPEGARPPEHSGLKPNFNSHDPYAVLGLTRGASAREIKRAYFALVREYPPEQAADTFKLIRAAYEKLRSDEVKAETDLFLFQPPYAWEPRKRKNKLDLTVHVEDVWTQLHGHGDLGRRDFKEDYRNPKL
jgi:curved DNA-binding protein CbpA